nr:acyl-CoA dehydrogenase family protein [Hyphomonas polymorpha]
MRVPVDALIGGEGRGFAAIMTLMPQERLSQAIMGQASVQRAMDDTVRFTSDRRAFGRSVFDFQNTQFVLAEIATELQVGWSHLDWAINRHVAGKLTAVEASAAKLWHTETQWASLDKCLQLHGGAGYMEEYPIARMWRDARVQRIYGGTSEILKLVIGRSLKT